MVSAEELIKQKESFSICNYEEMDFMPDDGCTNPCMGIGTVKHDG